MKIKHIKFILRLLFDLLIAPAFIPFLLLMSLGGWFNGFDAERKDIEGKL